MVRFIKQEAQEKANEIRVSAEEVGVAERQTQIAWQQNTHTHSASTCLLHPLRDLIVQEFNLEKLQLLEQEKAKIRKDYERKESQVEVKKKM